MVKPNIHSQELRWRPYTMQVVQRSTAVKISSLHTGRSALNERIRDGCYRVVCPVWLYWSFWWDLQQSGDQIAILDCTVWQSGCSSNALATTGGYMQIFISRCRSNLVKDLVEKSEATWSLVGRVMSISRAKRELLSISKYQFATFYHLIWFVALLWIVTNNEISIMDWSHDRTRCAFCILLPHRFEGSIVCGWLVELNVTLDRVMWTLLRKQHKALRSLWCNWIDILSLLVLVIFFNAKLNI